MPLLYYPATQLTDLAIRVLGTDHPCARRARYRHTRARHWPSCVRHAPSSHQCAAGGPHSAQLSLTGRKRAVFIIDLKGIIRTILYYPLSTGRNFDEIKRIIQALQTDDAEACATPADWRPGDDVIVPTAGSCGVAKERMEKQTASQYCLDWFLCFKKYTGAAFKKVAAKKAASKRK